MGASLARIRREVVHADLIGLGSASEARDRGAATRAFAYVWIAASLERFVRDALQHVFVELNALTTTHHALRASLFALLCDGSLTSIATQKRNASWGKRVEIFELVHSATVAKFTPEVMPLDGRTLRREHFENIWLVLGLSGSALPSPAHAPALTELAQGRNIVAHGNEDPIVFGRSKLGSDIVRLSSRIDDIGLHLTIALDNYLLHGEFKR